MGPRFFLAPVCTVSCCQRSFLLFSAKDLVANDAKARRTIDQPTVQGVLARLGAESREQIVDEDNERANGAGCWSTRRLQS